MNRRDPEGARPPRARHALRPASARGRGLIAVLCAFGLVTALCGAAAGVVTRPGGAGGEPKSAAAAKTSGPPSASASTMPSATAPAPTAPSSPSSPAPEPTPSATGLAEALAAAVAGLEASTGARLGVAVRPAGAGGGLTEAGSWTTGHAWSTIKAPLAIAALTADAGASTDADAAKAITVSDNAAAQSLWDGLGGGDAAGAAVEAALRSGGDSATSVQRVKTRPEFSAFGQTTWALADQVGFAAGFPSGAAGDRVWSLMGQIDGSQRWGLGRFAGARFKGGWGPDDSGYVVRQFGQIPVGGGCAAVAVGAWAPGFDSGVAALDALADALAGLEASLPTGSCR